MTSRRAWALSIAVSLVIVAAGRDYTERILVGRIEGDDPVSRQRSTTRSKVAGKPSPRELSASKTP